MYLKDELDVIFLYLFFFLYILIFGILCRLTWNETPELMTWINTRPNNSIRTNRWTDSFVHLAVGSAHGIPVTHRLSCHQPFLYDPTGSIAVSTWHTSRGIVPKLFGNFLGSMRPRGWSSNHYKSYPFKTGHRHVLLQARRVVSHVSVRLGERHVYYEGIDAAGGFERSWRTGLLILSPHTISVHRPPSLPFPSRL